MQRLHEECAESSDEHRSIRMDSSNWSVVGKPAWSTWIHQLHHSLLAVWSSDAIAKRPPQRLAHRFEGIIQRWAVELHLFIVPARNPSSLTMPIGTLNV
jgi:hypothetical protein